MNLVAALPGMVIRTIPGIASLSSSRMNAPERLPVQRSRGRLLDCVAEGFIRE